jgi:HPt (histidine-containing phosphotransfer) domain-containing protein
LADPPDDLDATIASLWRDARPRALGRVAVVEEALAALRAGRLDPALAEQARGEAHKLAGALGTFGMPLGTDRARAVERRLAAGAAPGDAPALTAVLRELRRIVEAGPPAPG